MMRVVITAVTAGLLVLAAPAMAKVGFGSQTEEEETLGNSGKPAAEDQGGEGTTTTTTTTTGPRGQLKNGNTDCQNCETTTTTDLPGRNR